MINKKLLTAAAFIALTSSACIAKDLGDFSIGIEGSHLFNVGEKEQDSVASTIGKVIKDKKGFFNTFRISAYLQGYVMEDFYLGVKGNYHINSKLTESVKIDYEKEDSKTDDINLYLPNLGIQAFAGYDLYSDSNFTFSLEAGAGWRKYEESKKIKEFFKKKTKTKEEQEEGIRGDTSKPFDINLALKTTYKTDIVDIYAKIGYEYDFFSIEDFTPKTNETDSSQETNNLSVGSKVFPQQKNSVGSKEFPQQKNSVGSKEFPQQKNEQVERDDPEVSSQDFGCGDGSAKKENTKMAPSPVSGHNFIFSIGLSKSF